SNYLCIPIRGTSNGSHKFKLENGLVCDSSEVKESPKLSEYFAEYLYKEYWLFLDELAHYNLSDIPPCSLNDYEIALEITSKISPSNVDSLTFSLAMHERLPKIEFYH
ncbi:hypothetical protein MXB_5135, partial [Myxobolus squamalis]